MMQDVARKARRKLGAYVVDQLFIRAAGLGLRVPAARPDVHGIERIVDVPYLPTNARAHMLDVYRPRGAQGPLPVVMYVHGGAFRSLSKDTHLLMALAFARRGCLVFNVNYRLAPRHRFPAGLTDVVEAYRWVVEHAASYGGDLSRLVFAGESAGANLAAALTATLCWQRPEPFARRAFDVGVVPKAVVAACGVYQVTEGERFRDHHGDSWFWNDRYYEMEEDYLPPSSSRDIGPGGCELADPLLVYERAIADGVAPARPLPAFFLPCGGGDHLYRDSLRMAAALSQAGVANEARVYANELHAFHAFVVKKHARACWNDTFLFLERHGVTGLKPGVLRIRPTRPAGSPPTSSPARRAA
jgi:acetyl esterase